MSLITSKYFVFNHKNSQDFGVVNCFFGDKEISNIHRTVQKEEFNMSNYKLNAYGTIDDEPISFKFSIVKCDEENFTQAESLEINEWLMSPKIYKPFQFVYEPNTEYDEMNLHYYAVCTSIEDEVINGLNGKTLTFETNSSYAFMNVQKRKIEINDEKELIFNNPIMLDNELTFPILTIDSDQKIVIENLSLDIKCEYDCSNIGKLTIDNEKMKILSDGKLIPYSLIGWKDDDINWLKFKSGNNKLKITGKCILTIEYEYKRKAGGI